MADTANETATPEARQLSGSRDIDLHIGARMRQRRIKLGLTQQQMAELIGVTYQQAHKYEKGVNRLAAARLYQIACALGVDISYFFEGALAGHEDSSDGRPNSSEARSIAAPTKFVVKLMDVWALDEEEAAKLLGFEDQESVLDLISGSMQLNTRDLKDRVRHLLRMREALHSLFRDIETEREWLREPRPELNDRSPLGLLMEGSMENFLVVSQFVQWMAGR